MAAGGGETPLTPGPAGGKGPVDFDPGIAAPARIQDYLLDGKDNYQADRAAADTILEAAPEFRDNVQASRAFLGRAIRFLAAEAEIRQFLDVGAGMPGPPSVYDIAASHGPAEPRVLHVDNDKVVAAHVRAQYAMDAPAATVLADLRDTERVLAEAARFLDFSRPVGLLLSAVLHFIPDDDDPPGLVAAYRDALPDGSYLVLSHGTADFHSPEVTDAAVSVYEAASAPLALRTRSAVEKLLDGWELEPPGLVQAPLWRADSPPGPEELDKSGVYVAVAVKN